MPGRGLAALLFLTLAGCTTADSAAGPSGSPPSGFIVITAGGTALIDGESDVPPTLDLAVAGSGVTTSAVAARLDQRTLNLSSGTDIVRASVAPLAYGSQHRLEIGIAGRPWNTLDFQVVDRTGVSAAAWLGSDGAPVADVVFERAPQRDGIAPALAKAQPAWLDPTHVRLHWSGPAAALDIPAGIAAERGSVLDGPLHLSLEGLRTGALRRVTVPLALAAPANLAVTLWSTGTSASRASTQAHAGRAAALSPTGWRASSDGSLLGAPDPVTVAVAAATGRPLWPLLANDFGDVAGTSRLLADTAARARLVAAVVDHVRGLGLAGIHLDFEAVSGDDRDHLSAFAVQLAAGLHAAGAQLAVDVIPHRPGSVNSASAAYDDVALAAAADRLVVMAYDEHTQAGDPGPVAGLGWQAEEIAGTVQGVPPGKVVIGLPLYARRWSGPSVSANSYADAVARALGEPGVTYDYDFAAATPVLRSRPNGVDTQVWFDDADSLLRKVAPVNRFGFAGVAVWRAGFEDPAFWRAF